MKTAHQEPERQISLDLARDWAALGAEVRRRAAVMAVVDQFLAAPDDGKTERSEPDRRHEGVPA